MKSEKAAKKKRLVLEKSPVFLVRLAELLQEGYPFADALSLLLPHHTKAYKEILIDVERDFRDGLGVAAVLARLGFSSGTLLPISIAENNGRITDALQGVGGRLEKLEEAKKKLRNLLSYPIVLFVFVTILLIIFRNFFLPNMQVLVNSRQGDTSGLFALLPLIVSKIPDLIFGVGIGVILVIVSCVLAYKKLKASSKIKFMAKIPIVNHIFLMWKTQVFAGELGSLLQSGISMQDSLDVLRKQNLDPVLGEVANNIKNHVIYGEAFHEAIRLTDGLTKQFSSFAEHGATSGHLAKELLIYSTHLEESIDHKLSKGLALLQPLLFSLIAICILAAYMALLLPVYGMLDNI